MYCRVPPSYLTELGLWGKPYFDGVPMLHNDGNNVIFIVIYTDGVCIGHLKVNYVITIKVCGLFGLPV